jgi:hypothetical protein
MRGIRLLLSAAVTLSACDPTGVGEGEPVDLTLQLRLAGGHDVGLTAALVYVISDSEPVPRGLARPGVAEKCVLATTPVTTCTFAVPRRGPITLIVAEPDPAVTVRFAPASPEDTVRDGRYVEFTGWTNCPDAAERGHCVVRPTGSQTIEGNFQLMQQVSVYQTGAARMDWVTFAAAPTLKLPAQNYNILDMAGCRRVLNPPAAPCDSIRLVGNEPYHRFTAFVPRQTIVGMFPVEGLLTEFVRWDGDCILSGLYGGGVCSLISPDTSGAPILLTVRYTWWECPDGPSDRDNGTCVLRQPPAAPGTY